MNKTIVNKVLILLMILWTVAGFAKSSYYYEDFSGSQASIEAKGWNFNFAMSRDFYVDNTYNNEDGAWEMFISNQPGNKRFIINGDPNADPAYDQWFTGKGVLFRPSSNSQLGVLDATPEQPFGFEIIRYVADVHQDDGVPAYTGDWVGNLDDDYGKGLLELWMVADNGANQAGDRFDDYVMWYDKSYDHDNANNRTNNVWGYYYPYENDYSGNNAWANMTDIDGNSMDPNLLFRTQYSYGGRVTNELGIRMTHNGSLATIYLNLDPKGDSGASGYQNSWIKFAETSVAFANDLIAYFGTESPTPENNNGTGANVYNYTYAEFGDFLIRTIASNLQAEIVTSTGSHNAVVNASIQFTATLKLGAVSTNDSGVGEVHVQKPVGYGLWNPAGVTVSNDQYGVFTTITTGTPAVGQVLVTTNGDVLTARFFEQDAANNNIVTNGNIHVTFSLTTPSTANGLGDDFSVYGDSVKHSDTGQDWVFDNVNGIKYATTGEMKATPLTTTALKIYTYDQPKATAKLEYSPNPLLEGNGQGSFTYKLSTVGLSADNPMITKARIKNPDTNGFVISNATAISADAVINTTNVGGSQYIYVFYTNSYLPGFNGFDKIQFNVYGTPNIIKSTNIWWPIEVTSEDAVGGTTWQIATNNSDTNYYQNVEIFTSNAQIEAKISPTKVAIFVDQSTNETLYTYTVQNTGVQNDVQSMRVTIPGDYDINSVSNFTSSLANAVLSLDTTNRYLYVYYTNVNGGVGLSNTEVDTVHFLATHTNTNVLSSATSVAFSCEADNGNGLGYNLQREAPTYTWSVNITPPSPTAENLFANPVIYTSVLTNILTNRLYNTSPKGVPAKLVTITFATSELQLIWASNKINSGVTISNTIANLSNTVYIHYGSGTNLPSTFENPSSPPYDEIYLNVVHSHAIPALEAFPVTIYRTTSVTNEPTLYALATEKQDQTNTLHIEYAPVNAEYYIQYTGGDQTNVISTTVETNSITYVITNLGNPGNKIHSLKIPVSSTVSTVIQNVLVPNATSVWNAGAGQIEIDYSVPIDGGQSSVITFDLIDNVVSAEQKNIYFYPWISNDRELVQVTDIVPTLSGKLDWLVPKPKGGGGAIPNVFYANSPTESAVTQQVVLRVTNMGQGTDQFKAVRVALPLPLYGSLREVNSGFLGKNSTAFPALFDLTESNLTLAYTNDSTNVGANMSDDLTLTLVVTNVNALPTNGIWHFYANNGLKDGLKTFFDITNVMFGSTNAYGTEKLKATLNTVYLTTETNKTFTISLFNGTTGSLDIKKIHILIPSPFVVNSVTRSAGKNATITKDANNIWLTYSDVDLLGTNDNTILSVDASKPILTESTNVDWTTTVIYPAEATSNTGHLTRGNTRMNIIYPQANFYAYMMTNDVEISKDFDYWDYDLVITNIGELGNNIYRIKITPPDAITNVTGISSGLAGSFVSYTNGDGIYVDYKLNGTNLVSGQSDVIHFIGYDNQTASGYVSNWIVKAAIFETNAIDDSQNPAIIGQSLDLKFITPPYSSAYYVTPATVSTVREETALSVEVANNGDPGNDISKLRITLADPFVTNGLSGITTTIGSTNVVGSNYILLFYTNTFASGTNDTISFTVKDTLKNGNQSSPVTLEANFTTSGSKFISSSISGGVGTVSFVMPAVEFYSYVDINDEQVSKDFDEWTYDFTLTNVGAISNLIYRVRINLPSSTVFTNVSDIQTTLPAHAWFSNAVSAVFIDYGVSNSALSPNQSDRVSLTVQDSTNESGYSGTWQVYGANWKTNEASTVALPVANLARSLGVAIITPSYGAGYLVSPNDVSTVNPSNQIQVYVNNVGSGSNFIESVNIQILEPFVTNGLTLSSTRGSTNVIGSNEVTLYYTNTFAPSDDDTILLWLRDSLQEGNATNQLSVSVNYNTSGDKNIPAQLSSGENKIRFNMPDVSFIAYVHADDVNIGKDYDVYDYRLFITNTGEVYNNLYQVKILPPTTNLDYLAILTNVSVLSNRIPAEIIVSNNGMILVNYFVSNQSITNGGYDEIVIRGYDNQTTVGFDGDWQVYGLNATNGDANVVSQNPALIAQSLGFTIVGPNYASTYDVIPQSTPISAFLPESALTVSINNAGSGVNDIESVRIYLDAPYLTNNANVVSPLGGTSSFGATNGTNYIQLDYTAGLFAPTSNDNIALILKDNLDYGATNADIRVWVRYVSSAGKYLASTLRIGGDNTVHFETPDVSYYAYVKSSDVTVSSDFDSWDYHLIVTNTGALSNHLVRLKIQNPDSNVLTNLQVLSNLIDAAISISNNYEIYVDYTLSNNSITNGGFDEITIRGWDNNTSGGFSSNWIVKTANYSANAATVESVPSTIGESLALNISFPGYGSAYYLTPTQISTFLPDNEISVHLNNVGNAGTTIDKVRFYLPALWKTNGYAVQSSYSVTSLTTNINSSNFIEVSYSGGVFAPGSNDNLILTVGDNWTYGQTNARPTVEVQYNASAGKFKASTLSGGDNLITFVMPDSDFYAYLKSEDTQVYMDDTSWNYNVILTNTGDWSNHLYKVRIDLPSGITNVNSVSGTLPAHRWYSNSVNAVFVDYAVSNNSLPTHGIDEISFIGWDNQPTNGYQGTLVVKAVNNTNDAVDDLSGNPGSIGESLTFDIVNPGYESTFAVNPSEVSTLVTTNNFEIHLNNVGSAGNDILESRISFAFPITNVTSVVSTLGGTAAVLQTGGTNVVTIIYTNGLFVPLTNDTVRFTAYDSLDVGETNLSFAVQTRYSTSGTIFDTSKLGGGTNVSFFAMPNPRVLFEVVDNEVYTSQTAGNIRVRVINDGDGSNLAQWVKLYLPYELTNGFNATKVSDTLATNVVYDGTNLLTLYYAGMPIKSTNVVTLQVENTMSNPASVTFDGLAYNGIHQTNLITESAGNTLSSVKEPSAEIVTRTVDSTLLTNAVQVLLNNNTSGSGAVQSLRIEIPAAFTNITFATNTVSGVGVVNNGTNLVITYPSTLLKGQQDTITMNLADQYNLQEIQNMKWNLFVQNSSGGDANVRELYANALKQDLIYPAPEVTNSYLKTLYYVKQGDEVKTNHFEVTVSNQSASANYVLTNILLIPTIMQTVIPSSVQNSATNVTWVYTTNQLVLIYTGGLNGEEANKISFDFTNTVLVPVNVSFDIYAYNGSSEGATMQRDTVFFKSIPEPTETFIASVNGLNRKQIYSIDHHATLEYKVNNGMYDTVIDKVQVGFNTNRLVLHSVYSSIFKTNLSYQMTSSNLIIDYSALGGLPARSDKSKGQEVLTFDFNYTNTMNWTNEMSAVVLFHGQNEYEVGTVPSGDSASLEVLMADFGRWTGTVRPESANPTVKVYYAGTTTLLTNKYGEQVVASASATTGEYLLDLVPAGLYDIGFSGDNYRETFLSNVTMTISTSNYLGEYKMRRTPFNPSSTVVQNSPSLDDEGTKIIVPPGSLTTHLGLDIWLTNGNDGQQTAMSGGNIATPNDAAGVRLYYFEMETADGQHQTEQALNDDVVLTLHYDETKVLAEGWSEDKLAIYYWKPLTGEWVRIGGTVDANADTVTAKVSYLHEYYAVIGESSTPSIHEGFESVNVEPKVFTPGDANAMYGKIKITMAFTTETSNYTVKIFTLTGRLIKSIVRNSTTGGDYRQGEVYWDGKDEEGYPVSGGVYVYRIISGNNRFNGTLVIAR